MLPDTLIERLQERTRKILEEAGRDRRALRLGVFRLMEELGTAAGQDDWSPEYRAYLLDSFRRSLAATLEEAVAEEEYEWAEAVFKAMARCNTNN